MMSIHKSKGLEADNVFFIEKFEGEKLIPSKYATDEDSKIQEKNLLFVAYTRAKKKLYICNI
jgi:DNA helicase-2/ATP-dependent DNA helicase PcrA